jgi:glyoxylase-like metal-dependent hydrolase (beta-lactamase superfamily II)
MKSFQNGFLWFVFVLLGTSLSHAADASVVSVSPKIYLLENLGESGNVAFLVTEEGVLVVDSGDTPANGRTIVEKIRQVTDKPIRFVVLTHYHGDHVWGLQSFPAETLIIAAENLPRNQKRDGEDLKAAMDKLPVQIAEIQGVLLKMGSEKSASRTREEERLKNAEARLALYRELRLVPPHILFTDKISLHLGGETVEIVFPGPAHTDDNAWVHFPGQKVIHMGDMVFHKLHPYIDWPAGSNTANWIAQLKIAESLSPEKVIPGHGVVAGRESLTEQARYLADLRTAVAAEIKSGASLQAIKKSLALGRYADWGFEDMWPYAIEAVYRELGGTRLKESPPSAFRPMIN